MEIGKEEILKIVDRCFHMYASSYRNDAREEAIEMIEELEQVKKLTIPVVVGQSEQLVCSCGSIKVHTTGGSQCPNNRCSSAN